MAFDLWQGEEQSGAIRAQIGAAQGAPLSRYGNRTGQAQSRKVLQTPYYWHTDAHPLCALCTAPCTCADLSDDLGIDQDGGHDGLGLEVNLLGVEELQQVVGLVVLRVDNRRVRGLEEANGSEAVLEEGLLVRAAHVSQGDLKLRNVSGGDAHRDLSQVRVSVAVHVGQRGRCSLWAAYSMFSDSPWRKKTDCRVSPLHVQSTSNRVKLQLVPAACIQSCQC